MVISITLLAGFVPLLQVCVHRVIGRIITGLLAVKDRDKIIGSRRRILIMWYQITGLITANC